MGELYLDKIERCAIKKPCVHHWLIDSDGGPTSIGTCKNCGLVREFCNDWNTAIINVNRVSDTADIQRPV